MRGRPHPPLYNTHPPLYNMYSPTPHTIMSIHPTSMRQAGTALLLAALCATASLAEGVRTYTTNAQGTLTLDREDGTTHRHAGDNLITLPQPAQDDTGRPHAVPPPDILAHPGLRGELRARQHRLQRLQQHGILAVRPARARELPSPHRRDGLRHPHPQGDTRHQSASKGHRGSLDMPQVDEGGGPEVALPHG